MRLIILSFMLVSQLCLGQQDPSTASPRKPKAEAKKQPGTKGSPLVIEGEITTVKRQADADREAKSSDELASSSWWTMVFTGWGALAGSIVAIIAFFQLRMFRKQLAYIKTNLEHSGESAKAARDAATAAKTSAESLKSVERAYVFIKLQPAKPQTEMFLGKGGISIDLANRGKTPAPLVRIRSATVAASGPIDKIPDDAYVRDFPRAWVVRPDGDLVWPRDVDLSVENAEKVRKGELTLYCVGVVVYADVFGTERETGFCWQYFADRHIFKPADIHALNYNT